MVRYPKILLFGSNGQIGWELRRATATLGRVVAMDYPKIDLARPASIRDRIREVKPQIIINAAAYTVVDKAEREPDIAMAINGTAPGIIAEEAKRTGAILIHYSTDYVYDGQKKKPYVESDTTSPLNVYGRTKLAGDQAIQAFGPPYFIFRTSWVYGWRGHNFLLTMRKLAREREEMRVIDDQVGVPNWSRDIAKATALIVGRSPKDLHDYSSRYFGVYHLSATGQTSWYGFAKTIIEADPASSDYRLKRLLPVTTKEYGSKVSRPAFSVLDSSLLTNTFGIRMPRWDRPLKIWAGQLYRQ